MTRFEEKLYLQSVFNAIDQVYKMRSVIDRLTEKIDQCIDNSRKIQKEQFLNTIAHCKKVYREQY